MKGKLKSRHGDDIVTSLDSYTPVELNCEGCAKNVRNKSCEITVNSTKCSHCVQYRDSLWKSFHRQEKKKTSPADIQLPSVVQTLLCLTLLRSCNTTGSSNIGL